MKPWMKRSLIVVGGLLAVWVLYRAFFRRGETVTETESVPVPLFVPSVGTGANQVAGVSEFPDQIGLTSFNTADLITALTGDALPAQAPPVKLLAPDAPNPFIPIKPVLVGPPAAKPKPAPQPKPVVAFKPVAPKPPALGLPFTTAQKLGDMFGVSTANVIQIGKSGGPALPGQLTSYSAAEKLGNLFKVPTAKVLSLTTGPKPEPKPAAQVAAGQQPKFTVAPQLAGLLKK